jgi:hypothetical protein
LTETQQAIPRRQRFRSRRMRIAPSVLLLSRVILQSDQFQELLGERHLSRPTPQKLLDPAVEPIPQQCLSGSFAMDPARFARALQSLWRARGSRLSSGPWPPKGRAAQSKGYARKEVEHLKLCGSQIPPLRHRKGQPLDLSARYAPNCRYRPCWQGHRGSEVDGGSGGAWPG